MYLFGNGLNLCSAFLSLAVPNVLYSLASYTHTHTCHASHHPTHQLGVQSLTQGHFGTITGEVMIEPATLHVLDGHSNHELVKKIIISWNYQCFLPVLIFALTHLSLSQWVIYQKIYLYDYFVILLIDFPTLLAHQTFKFKEFHKNMAFTIHELQPLYTEYFRRGSKIFGQTTVAVFLNWSSVFTDYLKSGYRGFLWLDLPSICLPFCLP